MLCFPYRVYYELKIGIITNLDPYKNNSLQMTLKISVGITIVYWLKMKQSDIPNGGFGVFAFWPFHISEFVTAYLGEELPTKYHFGNIISILPRPNIGIFQDEYCLDIVSIMEVVTTGTANLRRMVQLPQLGKLKKIKSTSWITTVIAFATLASVFYFSVIWIILFWKNVSIVVNKLNVRKLVRNASSIFVLVVMILSKLSIIPILFFYGKY